MSNAWFYYLLPLALFTVFFVIGLTLFIRFASGYRCVTGAKYGQREAGFGIFFILVGGALDVAIFVTSPTPWQRQRIFDHVFHTPFSEIQRFVIEAGGADEYRPLTPSKVVIDDPGRIAQIAGVLRNAVEELPSHPHARWTARIEMITREGTYYFSVEATNSGDANGTLVNGMDASPSSGDWNLGDARVDGLERILEDAVHNAGPR